MTREEAKSIVRGITDKIEATTDIDDWAEFWGFTRDDYEEFLEMPIKLLEQEPCGDAISRQAVQDYIAKYLSQYLYNDVREAVEVIDEYIGELPSVTPQPKTGHWTRELIRNEKGGCIGAKMICSECGNDNKNDEYMTYCPNCGAKMQKSEE